MLREEILPFIQAYLDLLSSSLAEVDSNYGLTNIQKCWLGFCISGILLTNSISWAGFSRAGFGSWSEKALSWMFRRSKLNWDKLFEHSIRVLLRKYKITKGSIVIDDTEHERSKNSKHLYHLGKQKDKKSGGYFVGQSIIFLVLITDKISIPVGFKFYKMDPSLKKWQEKDKKLLKAGVKKKDRPAEPVRSELYPTKNKIAIELVADFKCKFTDISVKSINADALYGTAEFMDGVAGVYPNAQVISQIRANQKIVVEGKEVVVSDHFGKRKGKKGKLVIRGGKSVPIEYHSSIAKVSAHGKKRLIVALKYEGEENFRYLIAKDMTWRVEEVLECFTLRWLVEVFFQDWKQYEGWGQLTKHVGEEGSRQSLILSLLFDHCLLSHPKQAALIENNLPIYTVGSLRNRLSIQSLLHVFEHILQQSNPKEALVQLAQNIDQVYILRVSSKHMSGRNPTWDSSP